MAKFLINLTKWGKEEEELQVTDTRPTKLSYQLFDI